MKLFVNASSLLGELTGIGYYTRHLLREIVRTGVCDDIQGIAGECWFDFPALESLLAEDQNPFEREATATGRGISRIPRKGTGGQPGRSLASEWAVRDRMHALMRASQSLVRDYLYWEPTYLLLPSLNRAITTVHDLSHVHCPEYHPSERVARLERELERSISQASRVVTVSEFSRRQIASHFALDSDRIDIVPPAVDDRFRVEYDAETLGRFRARHGLPANYVLAVGTLEPRKNLMGLMSAYESLDAAVRRRFPLVVAGPEGWKFDDSRQKMQGLIDRGELIFAGYLPAWEMPLLYRQASVLAYPSHYEGFGMPVAEAMAAGTAVLTSNCSALPETAGGAAQLVEPRDPDSIREGLHRLLTDAEYRSALAETGRKIARGYTWDASAQRLLSVFRALEQAPLALTECA